MTRTYWGAAGAGVLFTCPSTGRFLLLLRSADVYEPGTWGIPGGKVDAGEDVVEAAGREVAEETGVYPDEYKLDPKPLHVFKDGSFRYTTLRAEVPSEFDPTLNWESDEARWVTLDTLPTPLHPGVRRLITEAGAKFFTTKRKGLGAMTHCGRCGGPMGAIPEGQTKKSYDALTKLMAQLKKSEDPAKLRLGLTSTSKLTGDGAAGERARTLAFALPAGPAFSCPGATEACEACYAQERRFIMPMQATRYVKNWLRWLWLERQPNGRKLAADELYALISKATNFFYRGPDGKPLPVVFRLWESGDFHSQWSVDVWTDALARLPGVLFWGYTRSFHLDFSRFVRLPNARLLASTDRFNTERAKAFVNDYPAVGHSYGPWQLGAPIPADTFVCPATQPTGVRYDPKGHGVHQWQTKFKLPIAGRPEDGWPPGACGTCRYCAPKGSGGQYEGAKNTKRHVLFYDHDEGKYAPLAQAFVQLKVKGRPAELSVEAVAALADQLEATRKGVARAGLRELAEKAPLGLAGLTRRSGFARGCLVSMGRDDVFPG